MLRHLLFWPVTGPNFLARFSLEKVQDMVREELTDDTPIKEALLELQMRLEFGEIDDEQYVREEAVLMERLREVRYWREEYGISVAGGPVRVAGGGADSPTARVVTAPEQQAMKDEAHRERTLPDVDGGTAGQRDSAREVRGGEGSEPA